MIIATRYFKELQTKVFIQWVIIFIILLPLAYSFVLYSKVPTKEKNTPFRVVAYFRGDIKEVEKYDYNKITHLIYCFMYLQGNKLGFKNEDSENTLKACLALKKKYPHLKVMVALGGWGGCETCSDVFSSEQGRQEFATSVKEILVKYKADGIDIDWESPVLGGFKDHKATPADKQNFTSLIIKLRKTLLKNHEICFDANSFKEFIDQAIEWNKVMPHVDFVNLMTYGLPADKRGHTGHHTALYSSPCQQESIDKAIMYFDSLKVPLNKLVIGAAFYSFVVKEVDSMNYGLGQRGKFKANVNYNTLIEDYTKEKGYSYHRDSIANAPFLYNAELKEFVTFDDKLSVAAKTSYALNKKLGGIMFWRLNGDTYFDGLLDVIDIQIKTTNKKQE
jgi:chitinase